MFSHNLIKSYENSIVTKKEAILAFGTEGQKRNFKKNGKLTGKSSVAFNKRLKSMFEEVDTQIRGCVSFGESKSEEDIVIKELRGGNNELPYRQYMEAIVLLSLQEGLFEEHEATMGTWLYNFGLVNNLFYQIKSFSTSSQEVKSYQDELLNRGVTKKKNRVLELNFFKDEYHEQQEKLKSILTNLRNKGMIEFYKVPKAMVIPPDDLVERYGYTGKVVNTVQTLETNHVVAMNKAKLRLRQKYGITKQDLDKFSKKDNSPEKKKALREYHQEYNKYLAGDIDQRPDERLPFPIGKFWYNYAIIVSSTKDEVAKYLSENKPSFYQDFITDYNSFVVKMQESYTREIRDRLIKNINKKSDKEIKKLKQKMEIVMNEGFVKKEEDKNMISQRDIPKLIYSWDIQFRSQAKKMISDFEPDFILRLR